MSASRCVSDKTVSFVSVSEGQSGRNGESSTIRYSFDMFRFTTEPHELFLHCTVQLCEPEDHESCKPVSLSHFAVWTGICDTLCYAYSTIMILGLIFVLTLVISLKILGESENKRPAKPWNMLLINKIYIYKKSITEKKYKCQIFAVYGVYGEMTCIIYRIHCILVLHFAVSCIIVFCLEL